MSWSPAASRCRRFRSASSAAGRYRSSFDMTHTMAEQRSRAAERKASSGAVSSWLQSVTNRTPSTCSRMARFKAPAADSSPPTPGVSTMTRPEARRRRATVISTWRHAQVVALVARLAAERGDVGQVDPHRRVIPALDRHRSASPWRTTIGATVPWTASDGQTSALTSVFTKLDLPFLNSPTTATVTPGRRICSRLALQLRGEVGATRALGDLDGGGERPFGRFGIGGRCELGHCRRRRFERWRECRPWVIDGRRRVGGREPRRAGLSVGSADGSRSRISPQVAQTIDVSSFSPAHPRQTLMEVSSCPFPARHRTQPSSPRSVTSCPGRRHRSACLAALARWQRVPHCGILVA